VLPRKYPNPRLSRANCSRCFSNYHSRPNCRSPVRCSACFRFGHIAETSKRLFSSHMDESKWKDVNYHTWFKSMTGGPVLQEAPRPPHVTVAASSTSIPWILPEVPFLVRGNPSPPEQPPACECSPDLVLGLRPSSSHSPRPENSSPTSRHRHCPSSEGSPGGTMAFQFVDPAPFIPRGYNRVLIPGRRPMSRVILGRPSRRNLDLAIATVHPLPQHQVHFNVIRDVLADFLGVQAQVGFRSIQPCPLGQAFVRFNTYHDRDQLIRNSPHAFWGCFYFLYGT
jgi:hypothetical protein